MKKRWTLALMVWTIVLTVWVLSCFTSDRPGTQFQGANVDWVNLDGTWCGTSRLHDKDAKVTCWVYKCGYAGGISCLRDAQ